MPAKFRVDITKAAEGDLESIWTAIAADSVDNATEFVAQLEVKISNLEQMPNRCPLIPENVQLRAEYRHLLIGDYRLVFRVKAPIVYTLRIIHGNRLLDVSFLDG